MVILRCLTQHQLAQAKHIALIPEFSAFGPKGGNLKHTLMDKHVFFFQDENLNADKTTQGVLKMILGAEGLSMLALGAGNEIIGLEYIQLSAKNQDGLQTDSELMQVLAGSDLLNHHFGTMRAAISVPLVTLVPDRLFSANECSKYFQLLQTEKPETIFNHEALSMFDCQLVWGASPSFQPFVNRYQPRHLAASLIRNFYELASREGHSIFMNLRGTQAQITVFDLRRLVFYNTFEFNKPADLLYFVLLVFDQFRMNPEQVPLHVSGELMEGTPHYNLLYQFIQNIVFITHESAAKLPKGENVLPAHFWYDLLSL